MSKEEIIETMITQVMESFDFEKVHDVMNLLDWRWSNGDGGLAVPSLYKIIKTADNLLRNVAKYYGDKEFHCFSTGGFTASLDNGILSLQFILTETTSDDMNPY